MGLEGGGMVRQIGNHWSKSTYKTVQICLPLSDLGLIPSYRRQTHQPPRTPAHSIKTVWLTWVMDSHALTPGTPTDKYWQVACLRQMFIKLGTTIASIFRF